MITRRTATTTTHSRIIPTAFLWGSGRDSFIHVTFIMVLSTVLSVAGAFPAVSPVVVSMVDSMVLLFMLAQVVTAGVGDALLS